MEPGALIIRKCFCTSALVVMFFVYAPATHASVAISESPSKNISCTNGVCTPTANYAVLNVADAENVLASGNLKIATTGSGGIQARDIAVEAAISWTSGATLSLDAFRSVAVDKPVAAEGAGGLTILTNDGGSGGTFSFGPKGNVSFLGLSNPVSIDGAAYTLVNSVSALASAIGSNPNGNYALASNYDASQDGTYSTAPILTMLSGTVQGLGNAISNLSISHKRGAEDIALFESVGSTGAIENLRLLKIAYVDSNHKSSGAGGLVAGNSGLLFGDEVTGSISRRGAGGLAITNLASGQIVSSSTDVRIVGGGGGLVDTNYGSISLSHAAGNVRGPELVGGLVAGNDGNIDQSYATGNVTGGTLGGLAGGIGGGAITNSYATGAVSGGVAGGFVGDGGNLSGAPISSSYSTGALQAGDGGFACVVDPPNVSNDYWDITTSGTPYGECNDLNVSGVTGLTTQQLQSGLPAGFDPKIWAQNPKINNGFPYLINNPPPK